MSSINNVGGTSPVQKLVANPIQKQIPSAAPEHVAPKDKLELSGMSHLLQALKSNSGIRADKVAAIKAQIDSGTYEDDAKLDGATDKLLDELNK